MAACGLGLAACAGGTGPVTPRAGLSGPAYTLRVLASSELDDMQPILNAARKATGVTVKLSYTGTLDGTQTVLSGKADSACDAIWFASNQYLALNPGGLARLDASNEIMSSPVILGLRAPVAQRLGWTGRPVSWNAIARAAAARQFHFGMTDPARANAGFAALVSVATAVAGNGAALQAPEIATAAPALSGLFSAQTLKRATPGLLADAYLRGQAGGSASPPVADGLIDYESQLLTLNASGKLRQPLTLIYPSDGEITSNYPFSLLASASRAAKSAYTRVVSYLLTAAVQREIMQKTGRRPIIPGIRPDSSLRRHPLVALPFPGSLSVVNALLAAYGSELRRPARTVYVLDISGSMAGPRIAALKTALAALTGASGSLALQLSQFREREQVTLLPFSTTPRAPRTFDVPAVTPQPVLAQIRSYGNSLSAGGWTAIYSALESAYQIIAQQAAAEPGRTATIVLLTDGEDNRGASLADFTAFYRRLPQAIAAAPVFPVLLGDADTAQMEQLAALTGGHAFDARRQSLASVFTAIRGNQ